MKIKYLRQPNNYSCGPIALYNLLIWADLSFIISYRNIFKHMQCDIQNGTTTNNFFSTMQHICQKSNNILRLTLSKKVVALSNQIFFKKNRAFVIEYKTIKNSFHFVFIFVDNNNQYVIVNEGANNKKIPIIQYFDVNKYDIQQMWIIDKKQNEIN